MVQASDNTTTEKQAEVVALAKREPGVVDRRIDRLAFEPQNWDEAKGLAASLVASGLLPAAIDNASKAMVVLIQGRELGLTVMQSFRGIHVIEGRPTLSAALLVALVHESGKAEYFDLIESSSKLATYEAMRKGAKHPTRITWTIEDAERAGLTNRPNWRKHPADMLRARCSAALARAAFSDVTLGFITEDEALDESEAPTGNVATVVPAQEDIRAELARLRAEVDAAAEKLPPAMFLKLAGHTHAELMGLSVAEIREAHAKLAEWGALDAKVKPTPKPAEPEAIDVEAVPVAKTAPSVDQTAKTPASDEPPADVSLTGAPIEVTAQALNGAFKAARGVDAARAADAWKGAHNGRKTETLTAAERSALLAALQAIGGAS